MNVTVSLEMKENPSGNSLSAKRLTWTLKTSMNKNSKRVTDFHQVDLT